MSNPTTPFGWQMPTATDLVTDLPADFEVFGQAVATSMGDLLGGTSGQVLAKNSNTDMDFVWVTSDDANAIQNTIVDAKGDLIAASASDVPARLAVGSNGETLVADSSTSTGLRYTAGNPIPNPVSNSAMLIWQRGTSFALASSGGAYTADRWTFLNSGAGNFTISRQATGDSTNLPNIQYCLRLQRNSGQTQATVQYLTQSMESVNSIPFAGKTVTFSFYARAGANYSSASSVLSVQLSSGTGTDQNINTSFTGLSSIVSQNATLTTTWQRFTYTGTVASTATQLGYYFNYTPVGTAGTNDYYEVTGVQIDIGSVALPFRTNGGSIQGELAACQRYYFRTTSGVDYGTVGFGGIGASTTAGAGFLKYPVTMRTNPTSIDYSTLAVNDTATITAITSVTANKATPDTLDFTWTCASGITQFRPYKIVTNNSSAGYLGVSAEL